MLQTLLHLAAAVPFVTLVLVATTAWLVRRRPGRLRPAWLLGFGTLLLAADDPPLPGDQPGGQGAYPANHSFEGGIGAGSFQTCSGPRTYADAGVMYRYSTPISEETNLVVGGGGFGGIVEGFDADGDGRSDGPIGSGGVRAEVGLQHRWAGGSVGFLAGALHRETTDGPYFLPSATLRLGPRDIVFADATVFAEGPAPTPGPLVTAGAGIAFPRLGNQWEPFKVRAGISGQGFYLSPTIPLGGVGNLDLLGAYADPATWGVTTRVRVHLLK